MQNIQTDFVVGGVARNADYYFHKSFIHDIWDSLNKDNVLLLAPRRTEKPVLCITCWITPKMVIMSFT